ncbi:hypothetical protein [Streptosporangium sp. KLBMP 9127]|nr:hypothetical protein [Streptosporangium sp. KLBMP 9127]
MRSTTPRIVALTTALAASLAPLAALATPAAAATPAAVQSTQNLPLDFLSLQNLPLTDHLQKVKDLLGQGYVPSALSVTNAASPRYASVWVKDTARKVNVLQGLSATELQKRITELTKSGFQPTLISGTGTGSGAIFAAVLEKTTSKIQSKLGLTKEAFTALNARLGSLGMVISSINVYGTVEQPLYAAVWVVGNANVTSQVTTSQNLEQRTLELAKRVQQGLRPVLMAIEPGNLYTTVWSKGNVSGLKEHLNLSRLTYTLKSTELKALGYRPTVMDTEGDRFAAIWSKN